MAAHLGKLRQLILFFAHQESAQPLGHTKLYKLLYFSDMVHLRATGESITGAEYRKYPHGPVLPEGITALQDLIRHQLVREKHIALSNGLTLHKLTSTQVPDLTLFKESERKSMDFVLDHFGSQTATSLSQLSHQELAWLMADDGGPLDVELMGAKSTSEDPFAEAIAIIDEWYEAPDKKGDAYWDELAKEIETSRMNLREKDDSLPLSPSFQMVSTDLTR
jgi:uncharacterized phage-associated protein